jgi:threonine/homoserine/homoserine lactone efflux protein
VTAISRFLVEQRLWLSAVGGLFLCYLGVRTFFSGPAERAAEARDRGLAPAYLSTFALTLTNPMTILMFVAVFAGLGLGASPDFAAATALVAGVFIGSAIWWLILSGTVGSLSSLAGDGWMRAVNRISGAVILAFGLYSLCALLRR